MLHSKAMRDTAVDNALKGALSGRADVALALLFGSRARGSYHPDSDVDVAVYGAVDRLALAADLSRACGHDVQVVDLASVGYPLLVELIDDGVLVHEGARGSYARWCTHALLQLDLDRTWYSRMRDGYVAKLAERGKHGWYKSTLWWRSCRSWASASSVYESALP
jgi:predicted nucleotidyltransferase